MNYRALARAAGGFLPALIVASFVTVGCGGPDHPAASQTVTGQVDPPGSHFEDISHPAQEPYSGSFELKLKADPDAPAATAKPSISGTMTLGKDHTFRLDVVIDGRKLSESGSWSYEEHFHLKKATLDGRAISASEGLIPDPNGYEIDGMGPYIDGFKKKYPGLIFAFERVGPRASVKGSEHAE